jgi:hypothetical protein
VALMLGACAVREQPPAQAGEDLCARDTIALCSAELARGREAVGGCLFANRERLSAQCRGLIKRNFRTAP